MIFAVILAACIGAEVPATTDYALPGQVDAWLRHPVYGDPSFDAFERAPGNPIHRGAPPLEWPVNGFLFDDPKSGFWYTFVGLYPAGYAMDSGKHMKCTVYRSEDKGTTWQNLGPIFPPEPHVFDGDAQPVGHAPDVSVVYEDGRYHLVYGYALEGVTWDSMNDPAGGKNNGIGYAWAEKPEGPYTRTSKPVYRSGDHPFLRGKYRRGYAETLIRRANDWLVLAMMDARASWALVGMTAKAPEGPYSEPVMLRCVDDDYFHPPLMEFYPAFTHDGYIYAPATSVAANRNFQGLFRVPIERAMEPAAWELLQYGSVWHAEDVENEHFGIWGQTFTGFVDGDGLLRVMFPSRDPAGMGTINIASRPWNQPYRTRGFTLTGHEGPSLTLLKYTYDTFHLTAELDVRGEATLLMDYNGRLGPDAPFAGSMLHALSLRDYTGLRLAPDGWRIIQASATGEKIRASGAEPANGTIAVELVREAPTVSHLFIGGKMVDTHEYTDTEHPGLLGILAGRNSHVRVSRFAIEEGKRSPAHLTYLYTEAVLGAGTSDGPWRPVDSEYFLCGSGMVSAQPGARAKWNVEGTAVEVWAPKGPDYGKADILLDGEWAASADFHAAAWQSSGVIFKRENLPDTRHTVVIKAGADASIPLDVLKVAW